MALSLIIGSRGLSGRLSVRNNVSNYSTYLPKCQRLLVNCLSEIPIGFSLVEDQLSFTFALPPGLQVTEVYNDQV